MIKGAIKVWREQWALRPLGESVPGLENRDIAPISLPHGIGVEHQITLASPFGSELVGVIWLTPCSGYGHGNKICSKLALTWKLTLEFSFPAHCISNWKLNGKSRTNISKVILNAANELPMLQLGPVVCDGPPVGLAGGVKLCSGAWKRDPESPVGVIIQW